MVPKLLVFAGSIRAGALSGRTADAAMKELALRGADVTRISLADYPLPIVDRDMERQNGVPENAIKLGRMIAAHDGVLIATPEYNASIPPLLKNSLDWVSRVRRDNGRSFDPLSGKVFALCSSSIDDFGGIRCLYHLRSVLMACGAEIITPQCSVPRAGEAFDGSGDFRQEPLRHAMETVCRALIERALMLSTRIEP